MGEKGKVYAKSILGKYNGLNLDDANKNLASAVKVINKYGFETEYATAVAFSGTVQWGEKDLGDRFAAALGKVNRDVIDAETIFPNYLEPKLRARFKDKPNLEKFIQYKSAWFGLLSPQAKKDQYMLNLVEDEAVRFFAKDDVKHKQLAAIIGLDALQEKDGNWVNGGQVYGNEFFATNEGVLTRRRSSWEALMTTATALNVNVEGYKAEAQQYFQFNNPQKLKKLNTLTASLQQKDKNKDKDEM